MANKNPQKSQSKFCCIICDYHTSNKKDYTKHLQTQKHIRLIHTNQNPLLLPDINPQKSQEIPKLFTCKCGKSYKHLPSLYKHRPTCNFIQDEQNIETNLSKNELIFNLINDNKELKQLLIMQSKENEQLKHMMIEVVKNGTTNNSHNNTTNSHNKTFNLHFFLNETCKNAMSIEEFVEQIGLNLNDLEETARLGFAEGVSKMIMSRLNALDVTERPIHCSDLKRETLYIKNENKWEKEEDGKPKLKKAVKQIAGKNIKQIFEWQKEHPDYKDPETRTCDKYMKMLTNVMAGGTEEEILDNYEKVVRTITKETTIDKDQFAV